MSLSIAEIKQLLDLRSDTSTLPTTHMWEAMAKAELGDGGRVDLTGRGEDPTVYQLEKLAAEVVGKEEAMYIASGSLANHTALLSLTERGDQILVERNAHIYINEKMDFLPRYGDLRPVFYHLNADYQIETGELAQLLSDYEIKVLCLENTHNHSGGTCLTPECTREVCQLAHAQGIHVHLDGARIFNAAVAQKVDVKDLTGPVDSVMFCVSKGLCAPVGSLLVGSADFIKQARAVGKMLGTPMRQAGVIAAAGIVALKENVERLAEDHAKAQKLGQLLAGIDKVLMDPKANQTDFIYLDVAPTGLNAQQVVDALRERGLLAAKMGETNVRLAVHKDISWADVERAAAIVKEYFTSLK